MLKLHNSGKDRMDRGQKKSKKVKENTYIGLIIQLSQVYQKLIRYQV